MYIAVITIIMHSLLVVHFPLISCGNISRPPSVASQWHTVQVCQSMVQVQCLHWSCREVSLGPSPTTQSSVSCHGYRVGVVWGTHWLQLSIDSVDLYCIEEISINIALFWNLVMYVCLYIIQIKLIGPEILVDMRIILHVYMYTW